MPSKNPTKFDNTLIKKMDADVKEALQAIADKYGVALVQHGHTYRSDECPVFYRFKIQQQDASGKVIDPAETEFRTYAPLFGLKADDFGREFTTHQGTYRISGLRTRGSKYPILAVKVGTTKTFKFPAETVESALARNKKAS